MRERDYRAMRNPQTLASYRAWLAASYRPALPFSMASSGLLIGSGLLTAFALGHDRLAGLALSLAPALLIAGLVTMGFGLWRVARYRRSHPWLDEG